MVIPAIQPCTPVVPTAWHPGVGIFIGFLGFLGVIVPLLRDRVGPREKAIWTAVLAALLYLEIRSIHLDQTQHDREQAFAECEQLNRFQEIANTLQASMATSQAQFQSTMRAVNEDREAITGGNSYPTILVAENPQYVASGAFPLVMEIHGKYPLRGLSIQVWTREFETTIVPVDESSGIPGIAHTLNNQVTWGTHQIDVFSATGVFTESLTLEKDPPGRLLQTYKLYRNGVLIEELDKAGKTKHIKPQ